jgi:hypothetical protein
MMSVEGEANDKSVIGCRRRRNAILGRYNESAREGKQLETNLNLQRSF